MLAFLAAAAILSNAQETLPVGVIAPFDWSQAKMSVSGPSVPGMEAIDRSVVRAMKKYGVVGCGVAVIRDDHIIYERGFGFEELPDHPFLPTTASRCGSVAKCVTGLCALLLMDAGKLSLDEKVVPILESAGYKISPVDDRVRSISVRNLMDHTSGLPPSATYTAWRPDCDLIQLLNLDHKPPPQEGAQNALSASHLNFAPGEKFQYANANFTILARVIEARSKKPFARFLTEDAMPRFGVKADEIFVSKDQLAPNDSARGKSEAVYYQTSAERYVSFLPVDRAQGKVFGEAYRGYSTEIADGGGGIAASASGLAKIMASLHSASCPLSKRALGEILAPPAHYLGERGFDPKSSNYYSKGWNVRYSGGFPRLSHGGMTNHCGGDIGHNLGIQFVVVSNWNNAKGPYVDSILDRAVAGAIGKLGR